MSQGDGVASGNGDGAEDFRGNGDSLRATAKLVEEKYKGLQDHDSEFSDQLRNLLAAGKKPYFRTIPAVGWWNRVRRYTYLVFSTPDAPGTCEQSCMFGIGQAWDKDTAKIR